ncbi:MAG: WecB/TagA/CpsF family glycosyltransferase [Prevotellaceae bacterium]|nr:WecB/TagA/CpsF family glycosyltransferase [Candidatus Colivivens equi]
MSIRLRNITILPNKFSLSNLPSGKLLINTINAHSYNTARKDALFAEALTKGDVLIPDGQSIVWACKFLKTKARPQERIAGWDLFMYEMQRLEDKSNDLKTICDKEHSELHPLQVMFVGSSNKILDLIKDRAKSDFPHLNIITYSPPFKQEFSQEDNDAIISAINNANPDLLWIGMTAPKQEKWAFIHWNELNINCHVGTIGAVFDFYAQTVKRAPIWMQKGGLEWLHRLISNPKRMWKRYIVGNILFIWYILSEKFSNGKQAC